MRNVDINFYAPICQENFLISTLSGPTNEFQLLSLDTPTITIKITVLWKNPRYAPCYTLLRDRPMTVLRPGAMSLSNQAHLKLSDFVTQLSRIRGVIDHESIINLNQGFT